MGYDLYAAPSEGHDGYFRANITWMGALRAMLHGVGALSTEEPPTGLTGEAAVEWASSGKGLPIHKLCSNDGWVVSSAECRAAAAAVGDHSDEQIAAIALPIMEESFAYTASFNKEAVRPVTQDDIDALVGFTRDFAAYCDRASRTGGFSVY